MDEVSNGQIYTSYNKEISGRDYTWLISEQSAKDMMLNEPW